MVLRNVILVCALADSCVVGMGGLAPPLLRRKTMVLCRKPGGAILLCHTADMPAVSHSRHVWCVTQQTCLLCDTADMSAVRQSRLV